MTALYLAALLLAAGAVLLQVLGTHDSGAGGHDASHTGFDDHDFAPWTLVTSVRFWSFALLSFGLVGTLLTVFGLAGVGGTAILAILAGVSGGAFASTVVRRMMRTSASSHVTSRDVVGRIGRVLVPPGRAGPTSSDNGARRSVVRVFLANSVASGWSSEGAARICILRCSWAEKADSVSRASSSFAPPWV
jgi:hypothetical protein